MRANQSQRVVDLLTTLHDLKDDPYGARWSVIVRVLTECLPFGNDRLREVQRETEQALLEWWHATSSNKMRWQINLWLLALGSDQIPEMRSGVLETALRGLDSMRPEYALPELMQQTGYVDLARRLAEGWSRRSAGSHAGAHRHHRRWLQWIGQRSDDPSRPAQFGADDAPEIEQR